MFTFYFYPACVLCQAKHSFVVDRCECLDGCIITAVASLMTAVSFNSPRGPSTCLPANLTCAFKDSVRCLLKGC